MTQTALKSIIYLTKVDSSIGADHSDGTGTTLAFIANSLRPLYQVIGLNSQFQGIL